MADPRPMTLHDLCGGRAEERFDEALQEVAINIDDPGTTMAARKIILTLELKPVAQDRRELDVTFKLEVKFQGKEPIATHAFLVPDRKTGVIGILSHDVHQNVLDFTPTADKSGDDEGDETSKN